MIEKDVNNNSAWSHLHYLIQSSIKLGLADRKETIGKYINFALEKIGKNRANKAAWNFLRGLFPSIQLKKLSSKNSIKETLA